MTQGTYADLLKPADQNRVWLYNLALIVGGSILIALCAQIAIPLPFSPVPITGQSFAITLIGALLGSRRGSLAVLTYIAEGLSGLPVFAGGTSGLTRLLGPTGGYLIGFVAAAYLIGWLAERGWDRQLGKNLLAMTLGNLVIFAVGVPWLAIFTGWDKVMALGFYPFILGTIIKIGLAAALLPIGWKLIGTRSGTDLPGNKTRE